MAFLSGLGGVWSRDSGYVTAAWKRADWHAVIRQATRARSTLDLVIDLAVRNAKSGGSTWDEIGAAAGVSRAAAHRRWNGVELDARVDEASQAAAERTAHLVRSMAGLAAAGLAAGDPEPDSRPVLLEVVTKHRVPVVVPEQRQAPDVERWACEGCGQVASGVPGSWGFDAWAGLHDSRCGSGLVRA